MSLVAARSAPRPISLVRHVARNKLLYLILVPGLTCFVLFHYLPMYGLVIAFKDYNIFKGIAGSEWAGLANFRAVFAQPQSSSCSGTRSSSISTSWSSTSRFPSSPRS